MIYLFGEELAWESVDMIVDRTLMVENKAGEWMPPDTSDQLLGYLAATTFEKAKAGYHPVTRDSIAEMLVPPKPNTKP